MNAERGTRNAGTKRGALQAATLRVAALRVATLRSSFRARRLASSVHRSSFIVHRSAILLLLLTIPVAAAGGWEAQASGTLAWLRAVYFVDERRGWAVGSRGALLVTEDGGRSWAVRRAPTEDTLRDIYFVDEQMGWLVCDRSIYLLRTKQEPRSYLLRTTDGGVNWSRVELTGAETDVLLTRVV
ncbi:MAG TPA: YCF48-related protein, partial [Pyrinomonadaceae bacterium]